MIDNKFFEELTPVEVQMIRDYLLRELVPGLTGTANAENLNRAIFKCPHCGSEHIIKWGFNKKTQRFLCKECGKHFSSTTDTMFFSSNTDYETWSAFIDCEIKGLTLEEEADTINKCKTTCFNMRHKLYKTAEKVRLEAKLKGNVEMDCTFLPINLKGTLPVNMPRRSKKRGKHKRAIHKTKTENKEPQLCIYTAADDDNNILFSISHCGGERSDMYMKYDGCIDKKALIIADSSNQVKKYIKQTNRKSDLVPPDQKDKLIFTTEKGNNLAKVNELHSELKKEWRSRHGISVRHLQGYIDWLVYTKQLRSRVRGEKSRHRAYIDLMKEEMPFINQDICKLPFPVDIREAYGESYHGIYALT